MTIPIPTIIDLKAAFLRSQILLLSQPLTPSPAFLGSTSAAENALRQKSIDDALYKLNTLLRQHTNLSYGPQALRHVAEQIDQLYWNAGETDVHGAGEEWEERGVDLRREDIIEQLPEDWSEESQAEAPEQAARYTELQTKLTELNEKRKVSRERLQQYRVAKKALDPFEGEEAGLQENLVTKNGALETELEKMRMLMLRVERGLEKLDPREEKDDMDVDVDVDVESDGQRRLLALLQAA